MTTEICRSFGAASILARVIVPDLYAELAARPDMPGFLKWQSLKFDASGCDPCVWQKSHDAIAKNLSISETILVPTKKCTKNSAALLFALESYFALIAESFLRQTGQISPDAAKLYNWANDAKSGEVSQFFSHKNKIDAAVARICESDMFRRQHRCDDLFGALYANLLPGAARKQLGEFYTPAWLADHLLDVAGFDAAIANAGKSKTPPIRLLDPACGSGTFLLAAIRRLLKANRSSEQIAAGIAGFDLNPLAVLMSTANVVTALLSHDANRGRLFPDALPPLRIACHDSIRNTSPLDANEPATFGPFDFDPFDFVVGNPPWLAWDKLPHDYREQTKPLWQRYGFFNLSGKDSRYGGAKKELALLMVATAAEHFLKPGGKLAMVLPQTILQTHKTGDGFRRFGGDDLPYQLKVLRADDFSAMRVFRDATTKAATLVFEKGRPTVYPVPYFRWQSSDHGTLSCTRCEALPVAPQQPGSAWRIVECDAAAKRIAGQTSPSRQASDYTAQLGANTGGANGVYWVEIISPGVVRHDTNGLITVRNLASCSKQPLPVVETEIEADVLFPLLRWRDVERFSATPSTWSIIVQDPATRRGWPLDVMQAKYPKTLAFLREFESQLRERAAFKKFLSDAPFYSMYNISRETFAPVKVVWRRMDTRIRAAAIDGSAECGVVPQETCSMIAVDNADEAHYLAALLNSEAVHRRVAAFSVQGGKGFGSPGMLNHLPIRKFDTANESHQRLARLGLAASCCQTSGRDELLAEINTIAERFF